MAATVPARLSPAEGRKFALTVGGAFLVLAAILWWRGRSAAPYLGGLGALLALAGILLPTRLGPLQRAWMGLAHLISKVTTPIFMGVVYFIVLTPIGLAMRSLGRNPLTVRNHAAGFWHKRSAAGDAPSSMNRQF